MPYHELQQLPLPGGCPAVDGAFWRPNGPFVDQLAAFLRGKRVLEIFSGNGYLAAQLHARGIDVTATTIFSSHDRHDLGMYYPVIELEATRAVELYRADHDVLLVCWPTVVPAVLKAAIAWGAEKDIAYIGEFTDYSKGHLASCATDAFFESMEFGHSFDAYHGNIMEAARVGRLKPGAKAPSGENWWDNDDWLVALEKANQL